MKNLLIVCLALFFSNNLWALPENKYYEIKKVSFKEISPESQNLEHYNLGQSYYQSPSQYTGIIGVIGAVNNIVNIGKTIWTIIKENQPVVNMRTDHVSAIPSGAKSVGNLDSWSQPKVRTYQVIYENGFGMNVLEFVYRIVFSHSGRYKNKGAYIANASIYPVHLNVAWGYTFNAQTYVPPAVNLSTENDPLAGAEIHLNWRLDTPFKSSQRTVSVFLDGNGMIEVYQ